MLTDAAPELMTELVPISDSVRRKLPRWDPRLWSGQEPLRARTAAELTRLGLAWGRSRAQKASSSKPPADPARNDATPPCRAQQALALNHRPPPALASTALGGVGGPQAATSSVTTITPKSDAAEDRRRWASLFDSLEVRRALFNTTTKQYPVDSTTEVGYLSANGMRLARLVYEPPGKGEPQLVTADAKHSSNLHVLLDLPDHLGSTSMIIDHATSELVEARTYQPYGATESDYRPERWKGFREDYGFTGKEEDLELGLIYFGKRYLNPFLGRWMSADPLAVHSPGSADLNLYAYVSGQVLKSVDPLGLDKYTEADFNKTLGDAGVKLPAAAAPAPASDGSSLLHPLGGPVDTPLGCFVDGVAATKAQAQTQKVTVAAEDAPPMRDQGEIRPGSGPPRDYALGAATTILAPINVIGFGINGDVDKFLDAQQIGEHATAFALSMTAPQMEFDFTKGVVEANAPTQGIELARKTFFDSAPGNWSRDPKSIQDRLTLDAAKSGQGINIIDDLKDARFEGMEKWELKVKSANGRDAVVHYVRDPSNDNLMDFKFTKHSQEGVGNYAKTPDPTVGPGDKPE